MKRADNKIEQVIHELLFFAPYAKTISKLTGLIKGSRASVYRAFDEQPRVKVEVQELLGTKLGETPPMLTETKKRIVKKAETKNKKDVSGKPKAKPQRELAEAHTPKSQEEIVEVEVVREGWQFFHNKHTLQQKIDKSLEICKLVAKGYAIADACEVNDLSYYAFAEWSRNIPEINSMYATARDIFLTARDDNFMMLAYNGLEHHLKERTITLTTKTGRADKNGKVKTHTVRQQTKTIEPNMVAIVRVLSTMDANKFGSEREREKANARETDTTDYSLRQKTDAEIDAELEELEAKLKAMDNG